MIGPIWFVSVCSLLVVCSHGGQQVAVVFIVVEPVRAGRLSTANFLTACRGESHPCVRTAGTGDEDPLNDLPGHCLLLALWGGQSMICTFTTEHMGALDQFWFKSTEINTTNL